MLRHDSMSMAAQLPPRTVAIAARSTSSSLSTKAIVGATIGSVLGSALILLCCLPFILRAKRRAAARRRYADQIGVNELGEFPKASFSSPPLSGDASERAPDSFAPVSGAGHAPVQGAVETYSHDGGALDHCTAASCPSGAQQEPSQPALHLRHGLPSPTSPPLPPAAGFETSVVAATADRREAGCSPVAESRTGAPPYTPFMPVGTPAIEGAAGLAGRDRTGRQLPTAFVSGDAIEEPESVDRYRQPGTRSPRLSDSVRQLARRASAAVRRAGTASGGMKSKTLRFHVAEPEQFYPTPVPQLSAFEPVDTEARGEAYSYYHDMDTLPAPAVTYSPPVPTPAACASVQRPGYPGLLSSSTQLSHVAPISSASPVLTPGVDDQEGPSRHRAFDHDAGETQPPEERGFPEPPKRVATLPLQSIVSDILSPRLPMNTEPSVNPMDIMRPTTVTEMGWMVEQELVKFSSPQHPAAAHFFGEAGGAAVQPTPETTPEPVLTPPPGLEHAAPPDIEINAQDAEPAASSTVGSSPPAPPTVSDHGSPDNMLFARPTPCSNTPSPMSTAGNSDRSASSPRQYHCEECHRVFDQFHKLNHHKRYHERPHECTHQGCNLRFGTKTHLDRHINDKHNKTKKYYCIQRDCPYSRHGGKSFPRKDNWRRHMQNKHNMASIGDPSPEFVDEVMTGT